jgi:hypothetical protein
MGLQASHMFRHLSPAGMRSQKEVWSSLARRVDSDSSARKADRSYGGMMEPMVLFFAGKCC